MSEGSNEAADREAEDAARVRAVLAAAPAVRRVSSTLRVLGAIAAAICLLAGLALAIAVIAMGFESGGGEGSEGEPPAAAIRSAER